MTRTSLGTLVALAFVGAALALVQAAVVARLGAVGLLVSWGTAAVPVVVSLVLLLLGRRVRRLGRGEETRLSRPDAARVVAAAMAASRVGALVVGFYATLAVLNAVAPESPLAQSQAWAGALVALGHLVLTGVALLVESWCALDPPDDDPDTGTRDLDPA